MTSKNSFFTSLGLQFRNRIWTIALSGLLFFFNHVLAMYLSLSGLQSQSVGWSDPDSFQLNRLQTVSHILGMDNVFTVFLTCCIAIMLSVQGYAWLDNKREIDFFESQPISRKSRFFSVLFGSLIIFALSYLLTALLGVFCAFCMKAMSEAILLEALFQFFRYLILFLGIFSIATLAMMLCGNVIIALLGTGVFLFWETIMRMLMSLCEDMFYITRYNYFSDASDAIMIISSPVFHYYDGLNRYYDIVGNIYNHYTPLRALEISDIMNYMRVAAIPDIRSFLLFLIVLILAWIAYSRRKNEFAEKAIVFRPVQCLVKLGIALMFAFPSGMLVFEIMGQRRGISTDIPVFLMMIFVSTLVCCIMEIIYNFRFGSLFRHGREIILAAILPVFLFSFYRFDFSGYNRYVPKPGTIENVALFLTDRYHAYVDDQGQSLPMQDYYLDSMKLKDIEAVGRIAARSQLYTIERNNKNDDQIAGYEAVAIYTLKNGKKIGRQFTIPEDIDPELMDLVFSSDEYKKSQWPFSSYPFEEGHGTYTQLSYYTEYARTIIDGEDELLKAFRAAYEKDLHNYSFTYARERFAVGSVQISGRPSAEDALAKIKEARAAYIEDDFYQEYTQKAMEYWDNEYSLTYEVYPEYENTIAFLKEHKLWMEGVPKPESIRQIKIIKDEYMAPDKEVVYDDPGEIKELLSSLIPNLSDSYFHPREAYDPYYTVYIMINGNSIGESESTLLFDENVRYYFPKEKIPEIVLRDFS